MISIYIAQHLKECLELQIKAFKLYSDSLHSQIHTMDTTIITIKIINYYHDIVDTEIMLIVDKFGLACHNCNCDKKTMFLCAFVILRLF